MRPSLHYLLYRLGLATAETQTTQAERDCIARHAAGKRTAVEVGVWHGVTTCRIACALQESGVLYAVDNYLPGRFGFNYQQQIALRETRCHGDKVQFVVAGSEAAATRLRKEIGATLEFVFLDGDHSYRGIETDWRCWSGLLVSGGIIALHDSRSTPELNLGDTGTVIFMGEVIRQDSRFELIEEVDSLSVLRRR